MDPRNPQWREMIVDFSGPKLAALPEGTMPEVISSCSTNGAIVENQVFHIPFNGNWRAIIKMEPKPGNHVIRWICAAL